MKNIVHFLILLFFLAHPWTPSLIAQQEPPTQIAPIIPLEPEVENPDEMIGLIVLSDESALQVLDMLEKMTNKIILRRQDIAAVKINFNSRGPLTKGEAVLALESLLSLNAIMLTDMGGRFMKAVPATNVNSHVPEMIIGSTLDLPPSQQIYAKLFKFDYLQAETASGTTITPLLSQNSSVVIFQKSNAILIADALINLQRIERIINEMDKPQEVREEIRFIKLNYIQATDMQQRIENLIQGPLKSYLEGNTSVTADERTNQLILIAHPGNLEVIMNIIDSVDVDAAPLTSSEVFPLRQAKAEEVVPIIEQIISGQKEGRAKDATVERENSPSGQEPGTPNLPTGTPAVTNPAIIAAVSNITSSGSTNSSLQFSNFVGLSADERTNSIVAYGTHQDLETLKDLIEKIDIPLPQVLIEAIITQVAMNESQASGLESIGFSYDGAIKTFADIALGTAGGISINNGIISLDNPNDFSLTTAIVPQNSDGDTKVLSAPRIIVSHNEEGIINISESRPIITSSTSFSNSDNNIRSNVEYRDIGIQLKVTPLIGADGTVQMVIDQTIEDVIREVQIDGNPQPVIGKREATSTVSVKDGQIIILGGLQENSHSESNSYFPVIGRIPLLGKMFSNASDEYKKTEIIIFIRPKILANPAEADALAQTYVKNALETNVISEYLKTDSTGDTYLDDSRLRKKVKERDEPVVTPRKFTDPVRLKAPTPRTESIQTDSRGDKSSSSSNMAPMPKPRPTGMTATVASISADDGIVVLNLNPELDLRVGSTITLIKGLTAAGRVRIIKVTEQFAIANILPGARLRDLSKDDNVKVIR